MHTPRCNHAIGDVVEYANAAIAQGLTEIGMSDHSPMPGGFDAEWRMDLSGLQGYVQEVLDAQAAFDERLTIRLGLEADFHPGTEADVRSMLAAHAWDYVIGSVHYLGDWGFDNPETLHRWDDVDVSDVYVQYFDALTQSVATGMFDIIGHPDLIKKFGHRPSVNDKRVFDAQQGMLETMRDANVVMEVSSAGLRKPVGEIYPHVSLVKRAAAMGVVFSYGSDAHAPQEVGHGMDACLSMLWQCGVREVASFSRRQRMMLPIVPR